jgi:hypothetical protein
VYSFICFVLVKFFPLISCVAVCSFTVVHLVQKNCLNVHSASVNHSDCRKMKSQTLGTHGKRQERFAYLFFSVLRRVQTGSDRVRSVQMSLPEAYRLCLLPEFLVPLALFLLCMWMKCPPVLAPLR